VGSTRHAPLFIPQDAQYVSCIGMRQNFSPEALAAAVRESAMPSSGVNRPATSLYGPAK